MLIGQSQLKLISGGQGTEVLLMATNDPLPSHATKDGRARDSCFTLIMYHPFLLTMVRVSLPPISATC